MFPFASLPDNLAAFCRVLRRRHGFRIGPGELRDAAVALDIVSLRDERAVRHALRAVLTGTADDAAIFDQAFDAFFFPGAAGARPDQMPSARREPGAGAGGPEADVAAARQAPPPDADAGDAFAAVGGPMAPLETPDEPHADPSVRAAGRYSPLEAESAAALELPRVDRLWRDSARALVRSVRLGLTRRWRPAARGRRFDLRRTLRASLQTGGEALAPRWLRRPPRTPRFVLLIDGSRSMSHHARIALTIAAALASATTRLEVFTFSTALRRVTPDVRRAAAGERRLLDDLRHAWAGGTSIGGCLRDFLQRFGARTIGPDTVVMIASDGLDVGAQDTLRDAMRELHRRSAGIVWLNPLLETDGYEPTASGMRTARPYVTTFTSVSDAVGLARLSRSVRLRAQ
jgi:uncharacterized protein